MSSTGATGASSELNVRGELEERVANAIQASARPWPPSIGQRTNTRTQTHSERERESATSLTGLPASLSRIPLCTAYCPITGLFCSGFL